MTRSCEANANRARKLYRTQDDSAPVRVVEAARLPPSQAGRARPVLVRMS